MSQNPPDVNIKDLIPPEQEDFNDAADQAPAPETVLIIKNNETPSDAAPNKDESDAKDAHNTAALKREQSARDEFNKDIDKQNAGIHSPPQNPPNGDAPSNDGPLQYNLPWHPFSAITVHRSSSYLSIGYPKHMDEKTQAHFKMRLKEEIMNGVINNGWTEFTAYTGASLLSRGNVDSQMTSLLQTAKQEIMQDWELKGSKKGLSSKEEQALKLLKGSEIRSTLTDEMEKWRAWNPLSKLFKAGEDWKKETIDPYFSNREENKTAKAAEKDFTNRLS